MKANSFAIIASFLVFVTNPCLGLDETKENDSVEDPTQLTSQDPTFSSPTPSDDVLLEEVAKSQQAIEIEEDNKELVEEIEDVETMEEIEDVEEVEEPEEEVIQEVEAPTFYSNEEIYQRVIQGILLLCIPTFLVLHYIVQAPYGKHSKKQWPGPSFSAPISWFVFESPNLIWAYICYLYRNPVIFDSAIEVGVPPATNRFIRILTSGGDGGTTNRLLFAMFVIHYINRCIIYPLRMSKDGSSKNVHWSVVLSAFAFCFCNGFIQSQAQCQFQVYTPDHHSSLQFLIGSLLWVFGFTINLHSDSILRQLRSPSQPKSQQEQPSMPQPRYKIPYGGFYDHVSSANYFGEIVEWLGYAIASSGAKTSATPLSAWTFWFYTCSNLVPRAIENHEWYLKKFTEEYPKDRKILVPFIW